MRFRLGVSGGVVACVALLQACVPGDTVGLTQLGPQQVSGLVAQRVTFMSTTQPTTYQFSPDGTLAVTNGHERITGTWRQNGSQLCISVPKGECYEVHGSPAGNLRFLGPNGIMSEPYNQRR